MTMLKTIDTNIDFEFGENTFVSWCPNLLATRSDLPIEPVGNRVGFFRSPFARKTRAVLSAKKSDSSVDRDVNIGEGKTENKMGEEGKEAAMDARQEVLRRQRNAVSSWNLLRKKLIEGRLFSCQIYFKC